MPRQAVPDDERCRKHYTSDRKQLVIYQRHTLHFTVSEIARNLNMSRRAVERTLQLWRLIGDVTPPECKSKQKRQKIMSEHEIEVCYLS